MVKIAPIELRKRHPKDRLVYSVAVLLKMVTDKDWALAESMAISIHDQIIAMKNSPELSVVSES